jgi:hypothetical protein
VSMNTCGVSREELVRFGWVNRETQKCLVLRPDATVCGCFYTQHPTTQGVSASTGSDFDAAHRP